MVREKLSCIDWGQEKRPSEGILAGTDTRGGQGSKVNVDQWSLAGIKTGLDNISLGRPFASGARRLSTALSKRKSIWGRRKA